MAVITVCEGGLLHLFERLDNVSIAIASLDVLTSFELIVQHVIQKAIVYIGAPIWCIFALLLEFYGLQARAVIPGAGVTPFVQLRRSGPMGLNGVLLLLLLLLALSGLGFRV